MDIKSKFKLLLAGAMFMASAQSGHAESALSDLDREALHAEIRAYLLENPEILDEMTKILEENRIIAEARRERAMVAELSDELFNDGYSYVGGNPEGDITMVEFLDYRCGFCKRAHPYVQDIIASDGNIRYILKEFPILGEDSILASAAAIAVLESEGPEKYKEFSDAMMSWGGSINKNSLDRIARTVGISAATLKDGMGAEKIQEIIQKNRATASALDISGTPTFVIGDQIVRGALPKETLESVISLVRQKAE